MNTSRSNTTASDAKLQIFHAKDARLMLEMGIMSVAFPPEVRPLVNQAASDGLLYGDETKVLFNRPGFSLLHAWLKKDYPLSTHTHDVDCLYWIVSGALKLGSRILRKGDGFFVPANVPYTYVPVGDNGVEVLEFRHAVSFDFRSRSKEAFWIEAAATSRMNRELWKNARSPLDSEQLRNEWAAIADRFWSALDQGNVDEAIACCLPSATIWHCFDQQRLTLAAAAAAFRGFVGAFVERTTTEIQRTFFADGLLQQHVLIVRARHGGPRQAWAVCVRMRFRDGQIASIEEYIDRAGSYDPDAATAPQGHAR
jgi:mannose-6-phosphate isomerase-like protein (cupin superfamily)/ketosteroid isomerase-like protein